MYFSRYQNLDDWLFLVILKLWAEYPCTQKTSLIKISLPYCWGEVPLFTPLPERMFFHSDIELSPTLPGTVHFQPAKDRVNVKNFAYVYRPKALRVQICLSGGRGPGVTF